VTVLTDLTFSTTDSGTRCCRASWAGGSPCVRLSADFPENADFYLAFQADRSDESSCANRAQNGYDKSLTFSGLVQDAKCPSGLYLRNAPEFVESVDMTTLDRVPRQSIRPEPSPPGDVPPLNSTEPCENVLGRLIRRNENGQPLSAAGPFA
jgi:hypothetical protein